MKTLIFYLVLMLLTGITNAQEITELKEARVNFAPFSSEVVRSGDNFTFKVSETFAGEFEEDPLLFLHKNFKVNNLLSEIRENNFKYIYVTLISSKGNLEADFNNKGELVRTSSRFKNVVLPRNLIHELYRDHKGWAMVKNVHITRGREGMVDEEIYKIKLKNGKERKNIILEAPMRNREVAGN